MYFCPCWVSAAAHRLSLTAEWGLLSSCRAWALGCVSFGSCGAQAQSLRGMWDLPGPGTELDVCCIGRRIVYYWATKEAPISSVQSLSRVRLSATPWTAASQASLSITNSWSSPKLMSTESVMPSNHPILCRPLLLLPSIFPSIRVFSNESVLCIRWPEYWSFSFSISPSNEYSELISFRMDWLDLLAVQGTLKSLLQHHSSKASILQTQHSLQFNSHIHTWLLEKL